MKAKKSILIVFVLMSSSAFSMNDPVASELNDLEKGVVSTTSKQLSITSNQNSPQEIADFYSKIKPDMDKGVQQRLLNNLQKKQQEDPAVFKTFENDFKRLTCIDTTVALVRKRAGRKGKGKSEKSAFDSSDTAKAIERFIEVFAEASDLELAVQKKAVAVAEKDLKVQKEAVAVAKKDVAINKQSAKRASIFGVVGVVTTVISLGIAATAIVISATEANC